MNGYLKNFKPQLEALNSVYFEIIKNIEDKVSLKKWWAFGGGTALSIFHFQHRKSFDIDIFVSEAQLFDFLDPKWYIDDTTVFNTSEYRFDGFTKHLKLKTKNDIKVDFLLNEALIHKPIKNELIDLEFDLYYESIEDIIAKKIKYRKEDNLTRDIFDLAVAISKESEILNNLLLARFVTTDDLHKLKSSLHNLNLNEYNLELEKIEPQKAYLDISLNANEIILDSIHSTLESIRR